MRHMRGHWAAAQFAVAIGTFGWAYFLMVDQFELFWPATTIVSGIFFTVAGFLFARHHPDGRSVGAFGLLFLVIANVVMPFADTTVRNERLLAVIAIVLAVAITEGLLLYAVSRKPSAASAAT